MNISKAKNLKEYLDFFKFRDDIVAYRPISLQNYFFVSNKLFGLNPVGFRLITFLFFLGSGFLIVKIVNYFVNDKKVATLTAAIWLTSSIHFMAITWIAAAYNIIGTFFWLLTSLFFIVFINSGKLAWYFLTIVAFLITIGSFEFSITWPIIFGFYYLFVLKNNILKTFKIFYPFTLITIAYLVFRLLFIKVPRIPEYQLDFNIESIKALFWYFLWSFNIPEEFKKQIVDNILIFNGKFFAEYWPLIIKTFLGAVLILLISVFIPLARLIKNRFLVNFRLMCFAIFWFLIGISPVLFLPNHTFSMYLTLASIGLYLFLSYFVTAGFKYFIIPLILIWVVTSSTTISFYKLNSWMVESQRFSKEFSEEVINQYPILLNNSIIFYDLPDRRHIQALLDQHAIRTLYNDSTLSIYYNKEVMIKDLKACNYNRPVYIFQLE